MKIFELEVGRRHNVDEIDQFQKKKTKKNKKKRKEKKNVSIEGGAQKN